TREIAADDAFDGERFGFLHDHAAARELVGERLEVRRQRIVRFGEQMVGHQRGKFFEPEMRNLGEHFTLARDAVGHDDVESRNAIAGDEQEAVAEIENFADLAAFHLFNSRQIKLKHCVIWHDTKNKGSRAGSRESRAANSLSTLDSRLPALDP